MSDNPAYTHLWTPPAPPEPLRPLIARLWDTRHAEDWILNGSHPHDRAATGDYLTALGTAVDGRWARLEDEVLRISNREWLRHITEVSALDAGDMPMPMFHLYARLGDDNLPATGPTLTTFTPTADPGMPTDATVELPVNTDVDELLEWLLWLPFDGRRQLQP